MLKIRPALTDFNKTGYDLLHEKKIVYLFIVYARLGVGPPRQRIHAGYRGASHAK